VRLLLITWAIGLLLVLFSYSSIDRPLCDWVEGHRVRQQFVADKKSPLSEIHHSVTTQLHGWDQLADWPPLMSVLAPWLLLMAVPMKPGRLRDFLLLLGMSVLMTYAMKSELKCFFGRDWPISWQGNSHSWIRDHSYGFHFFRSALNLNAESASSFPSGHAAIAFATFLPMGVIFRRALPWFLLAASLESAAMVVLNYHFLSDVLAGALLGITCTMVSATLLGIRLSRPEELGQLKCDTTA
jgi:membrane-associated phospholipid phosphatase